MISTMRNPAEVFISQGKVNICAGCPFGVQWLGGLACWLAVNGYSEKGMELVKGQEVYGITIGKIPKGCPNEYIVKTT